MASTRFINPVTRKKVKGYEGEPDLVLIQLPEAWWDSNGPPRLVRNWERIQFRPHWLQMAWDLVSEEGAIAVCSKPSRSAIVLREFHPESNFVEGLYGGESRDLMILSPSGEIDTPAEPSLQGDVEDTPVEYWRQVIEQWSEPGDFVLDLALGDAKTAEATHNRKFIGLSHNTNAFERAEQNYETETSNALNW